MDIILLIPPPTRSSFVPAEDEGVLLANFYLDHHEPWTAQTQTIAWLNRPYTYDDEIALFFLDQEELIRPPMIETLSWLARPYLDDEITGANLANFALEQEEPWVARTEYISWLPRPFPDDDTISNFPLEQEEFWTAQYQINPWLARPFTDDEITGAGLKYFYLEQEEFWTAQTEFVAWLPRPALDDEITGAGLGNFSLEQEEFWTAKIQTITWLRSPFTDTDERPTPTVLPCGGEQEEGPFVIQPRQSTPWSAKNFLDEDGLAINICYVSQAGVYGVYGVMGGPGGPGQTGAYRVANNNTEGYVIWIGSGTLPDLTQPPNAYSATLPFSVTLASPPSGTRTYYLLTAYRDKYGLVSQNQNYTAISIDLDGHQVSGVLNAPQGLKAIAQPAGAIAVLAVYPQLGLDPQPADTWLVWIKTTLPVPGVDTPTGTFPISTNLNQLIGAYVANTYYVMVALYRSSDGYISPNVYTTVVINSPPPQPVPVPSGFNQ